MCIMYRLISTILLFILSLTEIESRGHRGHIISGNDAKACQYPHIAFVVVRKGGKTFACGGSLLDSKHVLTSAHCVDADVEKVAVLFGSTNQRTMKYHIMADRVVRHPDFSKTNNSVVNDVAVVRLSKEVPISDCLRPIEMAVAGDEFVGECHIAGWGRTSATSTHSMKLTRALVPIVPRDKCLEFADDIQTQHVCAGELTENGKTTCLGDSGGPLLCSRASDARLVLVGVISYGWDCTEGLSVFARVAYFSRWITDAIYSLTQH